MKFNILFLDFDGVLITERVKLTKRAPSPYYFDPVGIDLLNELDNNVPNLRLVISSTWRRKSSVLDIIPTCGIKVKFFNEFDAGINNSQRGYQLESVHFGKVGRGLEIQDWFSTYQEYVNCYAILDDENQMLPEQIPFLVQTDQMNGITYENYKNLIKLFEGTTW